MSDEELIIQRLATLAEDDDGDRALLPETYHRIVASTVRRLSEAGRLVSPTPSEREQWRIYWPPEHPDDEAMVSMVYGDRAEAEYAIEHHSNGRRGALQRRTFSAWCEVSP